MKLEQGKRYVMANGEITGKMIETWLNDFITKELVDGYMPIWESDGRANFFQSCDDPENESFNIVKEFEQ